MFRRSGKFSWWEKSGNKKAPFRTLCEKSITRYAAGVKPCRPVAWSGALRALLFVAGSWHRILMVMPRLLTLGSLQLQGAVFGREKPLLLLAYLCLCGPQPRRGLARLFWPDAASPMNSLSVAIAQLRKVLPTELTATETQLGTSMECDAVQFRQALTRHDLQQGRALYGGMFLPGLNAAELGEELDEWLMGTREALADAYQERLLQEARFLQADNPLQAGELAALAATLPGVTPPTGERLHELHALLSAAAHPEAARVAREAAGLGLFLKPVAARQTAPLLGRKTELERLHALQAGQSLWIRGAAGLGKSALLRAAASEGQLLRGQSGQPFQTLLPLVAAGQAPAAEAGWLRLLTAAAAPLYLDDWEACDPESRRALLALARSRAGWPLVVASRERPAPLGPGHDWAELALRPVAAEHLSPEQQGRSGGVPALLWAEASGETLADAYTGLLAAHTPRARQLLACLVVQQLPDLPATCAALELAPEELTETLETLERAFLLHALRPSAPTAAREWLDRLPSLESEVLTLLAPQLPAAGAWPLYLRAFELTGASELPGFQRALRTQAQTLLDAGHELETASLLARHARSPDTRLLHARALDALGRFPEALALLDGLESTPLAQAFRGRALYRLGHIPSAREAARLALKGDLEARAQAHNLLGALALTAREYAQARQSFERAKGLFLLQDDRLGHLNALCNMAVAMTELGENMTETLSDLQERAGGVQHPQTLLNIGWLLQKQGDIEASLDFALKAAQSAEHLGQASVISSALINVGMLNHLLHRFPEASSAYHRAIQFARQTQEVRLLAVALGNLAELEESLPLIEEALTLLRDAGQDDLVAYFEEQRQVFMGRSGPA